MIPTLQAVQPVAMAASLRVVTRQVHRLAICETQARALQTRLFSSPTAVHDSCSWLRGRAALSFQHCRGFSTDLGKDPRVPNMSEGSSRVAILEEGSHTSASDSDPTVRTQFHTRVEEHNRFDDAERTQFQSRMEEHKKIQHGEHTKQVSRTHFFHAERLNVHQQPEASATDHSLPAFDRHSEKFEEQVRSWSRALRQDEDNDTTVARQRGPRQAVRSPSLGQFRPPLPGQQRCVAYCTAEAYDFDMLLKALQKKMVPSIYFSEVIHVCVLDPLSKEEGDVFFFKDGSIVLWDVTEDVSADLFQIVKPCQVGPYNTEVVVDKYSEVLDFTYGKQAGLLPSGELVLSMGQDNWAKTQVLEKIAFSHGIQRSVKISVMEHLSEDLISSLKQIPDILMEKRALKIDQKGVMKTMGQLLALRGLINLHLPLSETPEAYWEEPWLEDLYNKISRELDIASRIRTLNRKLDYAHQVVEVLRTELSDRHHTRLELIIIFLISVEVLFEVVHFFI